MRSKVVWASLVLETSLALFALGTGAATAEPLKIRGAWVAPLANMASVWLQKKDLAVHFGQSYVFEAVRYAGTPPMITAIANNELEIGNLAFSTLPIAIGNAGLDDIRVISDDFQDGIEGYSSNDFEVLADGPIKKIEDLKGKVLATNSMGSGVDVAMRAMLRKHGLEANRDYTIVEAPFPGMKAMLLEKKVDLITGVLPFKLDPELKKAATVLFDMRQAIGPSQFVMWSARKPFIDAHRAALVDFLEDSLRIERWYLDPKNHDAVAEIASQLTKQPAERFGWLFTKTDYYRDPNMMPNLDALQKNVDMTKELGFVNASLNVKAHSDLSLIEEAGKRLK
ncbi:MAG TPA: ABC transporter substrate-binding protein [Xanthobacteraceae bacterium]|jgi:NitT/TauT family transport system substrate-binding protein|nr:ABC transporter substrate-binding protein [Xanthobacteraceae bacterium]